MFKHSLLILLFLAGGWLSAETVTYKDAGLKFETPKGWTVVKEADGLSLTSPDNLVIINFQILDDESLEAALKAALEQIVKEIPDAEMGEVEEETLNGLKFEYSTGRGTISDLECTLELAVIYAKLPVMVFDITLPGGEVHDEALSDFLKSFKKLK